jgi:ribosomal protein S1
MQKTIGNEELAYLFEEDRFSTKRGKRNRFKNTTPESVELSKLYDSIEVQVPKNGKVVSAKYEGSNSESFIFEVSGYKDFIRVDNKPNEAKYLKNSNVGDVVDVLILDVNEKNYLIKGSISTLYESRAHANMKELDENASVTAYVKALSPAGYEMEIYNGGVTLPGFMPNTLAGINKLFDPTSIIGETFEVSIESYSEKEGTYIVSRRKYLRSLIPAATEQLQSGQVYTGHVTGTANFGVFVEFNECLTGMIHKANVHPEWQDKLDEIKPGFEIEFYVKEIVKNPKYEDKIILTQILRETLWDNITPGQVINGKVKDTKQFGTLIILDDETIGLIHTSEMEKMNKKFTPGQEVKVKVLSLERSQRKIFLTIA